ncbi:MAG TPA: Asp-tRNA(Asn)/Glu-tRNA(Gln) amidotransferase subunit GatA [bacterium]|nr:Asp-tRNA(Asn)/Glu-tRNA(Gln) amidotransferase subunit GatA [bacterium]
MDFLRTSLLDLVTLVRSGQTSPSDIFDAYRARIERYNPELRAYTTLRDKPETFAGADTPFAGVPYAVKDLYLEKGIRTTASSRMLEHFIAPYESTVTTRIMAAGASNLGKVTLDEFAMGGSGEKSALDIAKNPWDTERIAGGSSSGSAVAVAAGLAPFALGTDTGGSLRQPGSMCGVVGFKPTYGRNSRSGIIAMASSLDTPGTITRTVRDAAYIYGITAGHDPMDSTSRTESTAINATIWDRDRLDGMRVGIPKEYFIDGMDAGVRREIDAAIAKLADLGAEIVPVSLPNTEYCLAVYYIVMAAEVSTNLARYDGIRYGHAADTGMDIALNRSGGFGAEPKRRIMMGSFVLSAGFYDAYYRKASLIRELVRNDFRQAFEQVDVIATPVAPTVAWRFGATGDDPVKMYLEDVFTVPASLAGLPALSLPVGYALPTDGGTVEMPVGLQIIGPQLGEEKVFSVAHVLEMATIGKRRVPIDFEE